MIYSYAIYLVILFTVFTSTVLADTPANCTYDDMLGSWTFNLGSNTYDKSVDCTQFQPTSTYNVKLVYPDVVVDQYGSQGFWTLIYNQGVEIRINNQVYFAFSKYIDYGNNTVVSVCDQTSNGWYHNWDNTQWGCYNAVRQQSHSLTGKKDTHKDDHSFIYNQDRLNQPYKVDNEFISKINTKQSLWKAKVYSEYDGLTIGEIEKRAGSYNKPNEFFQSFVSESKPTVSNTKLPQSFDWRNVNGVNYISPIRNQGKCGSCYSFASMAQMEAHIRIYSNLTYQPVLSTQNIVSCSQYSQGCDGGFPYLVAGKYAKDFGAVEESCYPYLGVNAPCTLQCQNPTRWHVSDYRYVGGYYGASTVELMQQELVNHGPLAVSFEVYDDFLHYSGGVYTHSATKGLLGFNPFVITNHVVLIVGYGEDNGIPYWTVKNSWGTTWGENGFFRILRGSSEKGGECGIESLPVTIDIVLP